MQKKEFSTSSAGFEPTRAQPNRFQAKVFLTECQILSFVFSCIAGGSTYSIALTTRSTGQVVMHYLSKIYVHFYLIDCACDIVCNRIGFTFFHIDPHHSCSCHHHQTRSRCCGCDSLGKKSKIKTITFEICRNYTQTSSTTECHAKAENRRYCVKGNMYTYIERERESEKKSVCSKF